MFRNLDSDTILLSAAGQVEPVPRAAPRDPPQLLALLHRAAPAQAQLQGEVDIDI